MHTSLHSFIQAHTEYTILGLTNCGLKFRPSDWTERLVCLERESILRYDGSIKIKSGPPAKSIIFDSSLEQKSPNTFRHLLDFAKTNDLQLTKKILSNN